MLTFEVNSSLRNFCDNVKEDDESTPAIIRAVDSHEFRIIVIFPKGGDAGKLVVHMINHFSFVELGVKHGLSINGRARGSLKRLVVNVARWQEFSMEELKHVHDSFISSREKRAPTRQPDDVTATAISEVIYLATRLKLLICNKSYQPKLIEHILELYYRLKTREVMYESLKTDLEESEDSITLLEEGICFAQKNLKACERRVSAQKGQRNKAINRFATTIEALNLEAGSTSAALRKNFGYAQMKVTKVQNRLEKEKVLLSAEKIIVESSGIKLAVFEQLRSSITKLNKLNSAESIRRIMCVVLPLVIPIDKMKKGKHVFERCQTLHTSMRNNLNSVKVFEDAALPVTR